MKKLIDDKEVSDRSYYYLLDWNDRDRWVYMLENFDTCRLCELELYQYIQLFEYATKQELINLNLK